MHETLCIVVFAAVLFLPFQLPSAISFQYALLMRTNMLSFGISNTVTIFELLRLLNDNDFDDQLLLTKNSTVRLFFLKCTYVLFAESKICSTK